jgi:ABC-type Zn uptake system ZnuABC Zn-binding protein ZnuA
LKNWSNRAFGPLCALIVIFSTACEQDAVHSIDNTKLRVAATIFPLADWAQQIGGEWVQVTTLLKPGSSPHTYSESPQDVQEISQCALFIKVGLRMDDWGGRLAAAGSSRLKVLSLGDELKSRGLLPKLKTGGALEIAAGEGRMEDPDEFGTDPHFWLSPEAAAASVHIIAEQLCSIAPEHESDFKSNAEKLINEIRATDKEISNLLAGCRGSEFVSFHNAFSYFTQHYGLKLAAVIEEYPGKDPTERYVKEVITKLRKLGVKVVFAEPQFPRKYADIIAHEIGGKVEMLDPYGDASLSDRNHYSKLLMYDAMQFRKALCP